MTREHKDSAAKQVLRFYNENSTEAPAEKDSLRWFVQTQWPKLHDALEVLAEAHGQKLEIAQPLTTTDDDPEGRRAVDELSRLSQELGV